MAYTPSTTPTPSATQPGPDRDRSAWFHLQRFESLLASSEHAVLPTSTELLFMHFSLHAPIKQGVEIESAPLVFSFQIAGAGHAHLRQAGAKRETITSNQGDALVSYAPGAHYDMELPAQEDYRNLHIFLAPEKLYSMLDEQLDEVPRELRAVLEGKYHQPIHLHTPISVQIRNLLNQISRCPYHGQFRIMHLENLSLLLIIRRMYELYGLQEPATIKMPQLRTGDRERLHAARELLIADLEHPPSLNELSRMVGISSSKLKRGFHLLFGSTYTEQLRKERLKRAQELLWENRFSMAEIAYQLGYSDTSHFIREFSRQFGITPGKFTKGLGTY